MAESVNYGGWTMANAGFVLGIIDVCVGFVIALLWFGGMAEVGSTLQNELLQVGGM